MKDYEEFLKKNEYIINFIKNNNIENKIKDANEEAEKLASKEGKNYLHSYRFSKIYDVLKENNLKRENNVSSILELIENPFNKNINEILNDFFTINKEMSDGPTL